MEEHEDIEEESQSDYSFISLDSSVSCIIKSMNYELLMSIVSNDSDVFQPTLDGKHAG
ncbi:hypothetical protein HK096_006692, partial [Nowakowskiella sp. JEL0078]